MALAKSEAILLKAFNWSESSRTVVLFTRIFGRLALVDKGGRSMKSRRGRLLPLALLEITFYHSEKETSGYLSQIDLVEEFQLDESGLLGRLAYCSAACELLNLLLPDEEAHSNLFDYTLRFLRYNQRSDRRALPAIFITFFLRVLSGLGYHPGLEACVVCGRPLDPAADNGGLAFSAQRGGVVCGSCQTAPDNYIPLTSATYRQLAALQVASLKEAATLSISFGEASLILDLLGQLISFQAGINGDLKAVEFLNKLKRTTLNE